MIVFDMNVPNLYFVLFSNISFCFGIVESDHFLGNVRVLFHDGFGDSDRGHNTLLEYYNNGVQRVKNKNGLRTHNVGKRGFFFRHEIHLHPFGNIGLNIFGF